MTEDIGFLNRIIGAVRNAKLSLVDTFGGLDSFVFEAPFMDDELICVEIDKLKAEYKRNADELTQYERFGNGNENQQQKNELYGRQIVIRSELAYLFSHNSAKIDDCLDLLEYIKNDFIICLQAMKCYSQGEDNIAFDKFTQYIRIIDCIPEHFLACKMFGELLLKRQQYRHAIPFLRKATEQRPDDIETHNLLIKCYQAESMSFELSVESSILKLLTCNNLGSLEASNGYNEISSGKEWV